MGGAKNCPETPRQKMIGMMYLVLTAMLALNVSADILNGFTKLRHSMESSIASSYLRTEDTMKNFRDKAAEDGKFKEWLVIAEAVQGKSDEFYNYIEQFKLDIFNMCEGTTYKVGDIVLDTVKLKGGSDTNKPHQYAINEGHAAELEEKMNEFRLYMTSADTDCLRKKIATDQKFAEDWNMKIKMYNELFNTNKVYDAAERDSISWENSTFHEMPADAVIALLVKYQNDIRMAENDMVNFLAQQAGASDFRVNTVQAVVIPTAGEYIMQGHKYRAKIATAMMDTNQVPRVFVNGQEVMGGIYEAAGHIGENKYTGYVTVGDDTTRYAFQGQFTVGAPSATISNTDLNIMYSGYDNPFSISVPGVGSDAVTVSCPGASVTKQGGGKWIIKPSGGSSATISVSAMVDGHATQMGSMDFRVKPLPTPDAYLSVGGQTSNSDKIKKALLASGAVSVVASYGPDALIVAKFTVKSFEVKFPNGQSVRCDGGKFSSQALALINKVSPGGIIAVRNVAAIGPDGKPRTLRSLSLELQ